LARARGPLGHPKVDQAPPHRRELRRLRLRAQGRRTGPGGLARAVCSDEISRSVGRPAPA
jgi:hypothetical protein